jgi:hypothetical protein
MIPDILQNTGVVISAGQMFGQNQEEAAAHGKLSDIYMDNGDYGNQETAA